MRTSGYPVQVFLTKNEHAHLVEQAQVCGMSISHFLRNLVAGVQLKPRAPEPYYEVQRLTASIANDVNQIVRLAKTSASVSKEQIESLRGMLNQLYQAVEDLR